MKRPFGKLPSHDGPVLVGLVRVGQVFGVEVYFETSGDFHGRCAGPIGAKR